MYSTKQIEKILIASRKPLLARKIQYINKPTAKSNAILVYINRKMPDYILLYHFFFRQYKNKGNNIKQSTEKLSIYINKQMEKIGYIKPMSNAPELPFEYDTGNFLFVIYPSEKVIETPKIHFNYGDAKSQISTIYSNKDIQKILKDLLKNGVITNDYKLKIGDNEYSLNELLSNKNMPIKYSKNGNLLMYHGTTKENWERIKKTGGLKPSRKGDPYFGESFSDVFIYLTSSFSVAKSYASKNGNPNNNVILLVEIPDMDKLYVDTGFMTENSIERVLWEIGNKDYKTENPDILEFRNKYLTWTPSSFNKNKHQTYIKLGNNKYILLSTWTFNSSMLMKAVVDEDFSVIERYINNKKEKDLSRDKITKKEHESSNKIYEELINIMYELYQIIVKYYRNMFSSPRALRESMNNTEFTKNAVAYRGRIPLSYIHGVFDINGNKIE